MHHLTCQITFYIPNVHWEYKTFCVVLLTLIFESLKVQNLKIHNNEIYYEPCLG